MPIHAGEETRDLNKRGGLRGGENDGEELRYLPLPARRVAYGGRRKRQTENQAAAAAGAEAAKLSA